MFSSFYRRVFAVATTAMLGYLVLRVLMPLAASLGWAVVLAFLLHPLHEKLSRKLKGHAALSAGILTALTPFCVLAPLAFIGVVFTSQVLSLITYLRGRTWVPYSELVDRMQQLPVIGSAVGWIREHAALSAGDVQHWATESLQSMLRNAAAVGGSIAIGVFGTLISFMLMLFLLYYFLREGRAIITHLTRLIPIEPETRGHMMEYLADVTRAVVFGSAATALICGAFVGSGFAFVGLPSPVVFAVLGVVVALLPTGAAVILVPAVGYLLIAGRWGAAIFLALWTTAMWVVETIVRPIMTAYRAEVSTLAVFIGAIGGVAAYGILGLVIGPVLLSFVVALMLYAEANVTRKLAVPRPPLREPAPAEPPRS
jgi:predicted PurR-regulated permease PerM